AVPELADEVRKREQGALRQPAGQPGAGDDGARAQAARQRPAWPPLGHEPAATGAAGIPGRARSASAACSASVAGHSGLKLYHCSGAAAMVSASASATACVARWISAGSVEVTTIGSP